MGNNLRISGSGSSGGGEFENIVISGSGHINGDVKCTSMHISGSGNISGEATCGKCHISGTAKTGSIRADELHVSGAYKCSGSIHGGKISISGAASTDGDITGEEIIVRGSIDTSQLVSADRVDICFASICQIGEIGGGVITVCPQNGKASVGIINIGKLFGNKNGVGTAKIGSIEGDDITIERCAVKTVRGGKVKIMAGCKIGRVEYSESCEIDENAEVGEKVFTS